jgi:hypothetical protein
MSKKKTCRTCVSYVKETCKCTNEDMPKAREYQGYCSLHSECNWCNKGYRFEFNWIDSNGNTITTNDHMVIGGVADYCPICGRKLSRKTP